MHPYVAWIVFVDGIKPFSASIAIPFPSKYRFLLQSTALNLQEIIKEIDLQGCFIQ